MLPIPASTFWSISVGLIAARRLAQPRGQVVAADLQRVGPVRPGERRPRPRRRRRYQAILPSRRASQNQTDRPAPSSRNVRRMCSGRSGVDEPKSSRHPGLDDDNPPVPGQRDHDPLAPPAHAPRPSHPPPARSNSSRRAPLEQERVVDLEPRARSGPARAGRSPRTIVSTSGNSGIGDLLRIAPIRILSGCRLDAMHRAENPSYSVKFRQNFLKVLDRLLMDLEEY